MSHALEKGGLHKPSDLSVHLTRSYGTRFLSSLSHLFLFVLCVQIVPALVLLPQEQVVAALRSWQRLRLLQDVFAYAVNGTHLVPHPR